MITMDMTTYRSSVSMDRFLSVMTDNLTINPHAVYVFEEIDKANVQVLDRLYFLLDEGIFYDRNQKPMYARGCFVIRPPMPATMLLSKTATRPTCVNYSSWRCSTGSAPVF